MTDDGSLNPFFLKLVDPLLKHISSPSLNTITNKVEVNSTIHYCDTVLHLFILETCRLLCYLTYSDDFDLSECTLTYK